MKHQHIAVYIRVSTNRQEFRSQEPDLERWIEAYADGQDVVLYRDKASGKHMDRPGWNRLEAVMATGRVSKIVVWRMDRLGRTASGPTALFDELQRRNVGFESLRDKVDLSTPAGRLLANVLASVAAYENEVRGERIRAGQAAAKAAGKSWGGRKKGHRVKVTDEQQTIIRRMAAEGQTKVAMARATGLSRMTVYDVLTATA